MAAAALAGCSAVPAPTPTAAGERPVGIEGLVSLGERGHDGATVALYRAEDLALPDAPPAARAVSGESGRFLLDADPGSYLLIARAPGHFAWFGRNPVRAHAELRGLSLPLVPERPVATTAAAPGEERAEGTVRHGGAPAEGVSVAAYLRPDEGFRGPPYASARATGADGHFRLPLEPGSYYLVARRRSSGQTMGPMEPGDLFGVHPSTPLRLRAGEALTADFDLVEVPSPERMARFRTRFATLSGTVTDGSGHPLAGFRACLYDNPRMLDEPLDVSPPTGPDGRFLLHTTRTGNFHLGARETLGGPPASGERVGFPRPAPAEGYALAPGASLDDLRLVVQPAP